MSNKMNKILLKTLYANEYMSYTNLNAAKSMELN